VGDIGEALSDIGSAGKNNALDPGANRRLGGAGISAAIEEHCALRRRDSRARSGDERAEPARSGIDPGVGRAGEGDRPPRFRRRAQRRDAVRQRMDDDDGTCFHNVWTAGVSPAMRPGRLRSGQAIAPK